MSNQPPRLAFIALLAASFLVAMGYGVLLPVLPGIVARLDEGAARGDILLHMGFVTAVYSAAALIVAPFWGRLSDRLSSPAAIVISLLLTGSATIASAFAASFLSLYFWRIVAGAGAGAASPAIQAWLARWAPNDARWQTQRVVWPLIAANSGFLLGPFIGGLAASFGSGASSPLSGLQLSVFITGGLLAVSAALVMVTVHNAPASRSAAAPVVGLLRRIAPFLLALLVSTLAVGAFEVALTMKIKTGQMSPLAAGLLLAECTLFMSAAQALLLLPRFRDGPVKPVIAPAFVLLAIGTAGAGLASGTPAHVVSTALFAAGGGLLPPLLAREIATADDGASGSATGFQFAASQAGQTAGGSLAGAIAAVSQPDWVFAIAALVAIVMAMAIVRWQPHATAVKGVATPVERADVARFHGKHKESL